MVALGAVFIATAAPPVYAQNRDFLRRIPDAVTPEPLGSFKTRTDAARVNFPVDPDTLRDSLNVVLSTACGRLRFNQRAKGRFYVIVPIPNEKPRRFGYADSQGTNLYDPGGIGVADRVYLFHRDGTSECRVYSYLQRFQ